jgi:hypothetical protein
MGFLPSVLDGMVGYRALFGALSCAAAPLFGELARHPDSLRFLQACWAASRIIAGRWLLAVVASQTAHQRMFER